MGAFEDAFTWSTTRMVKHADITWTVGIGEKGTVDLVFSSATQGHLFTLSLGYNQAETLRQQLAAVISLAGKQPPSAPAENT